MRSRRMAETIVASPIVHEVLNPDVNYEEWKIRLETYLKAHNLWDVVEPNDETSEGQNEEENDETSEEGSSVPANDDHCSEQGKSEEVNGETSEKGKSAEVNGEHSDDEENAEANDEAKNAGALHAIHISCGSDAFWVIKDIDSAKDAWKTLEGKYGPKAVPYNREDKKFESKDFFEAVRNIKDDWRIVKDILTKHPQEEEEIVRKIHPGTKETGLHVAATAGNENIVKELVKLMQKEDLEIKGTDECTALTEAVLTGMTSIAKCMVEKNEKLVSIAGPDKLLPVVDALSFGHKDMADYLYSKTPEQNLSPENDFNNAAALLFWSIDAKDYDIALDMLNRFPRLAITVHEDYGSPFYTLAQNPAMFPSTSTRGFNFWQRWLYNGINVQNQHAAADDIHVNVQNEEDSQTSRKNICCTGLLKWLRSYVSKRLGIEHIHKMKFGHDRTKEILQKMCEVIKTLDDKELEDLLVVEALHKATANGMVEFFVALIEANPELLWLNDKTGKNLFMVAVEHRQPKIFSHIHGLKSKQAIAALIDSSHNNMLHMAGLLAPSSQLRSIAGPALQMQRELQWFEEVEKVISPSLKEVRNADDETPQELFTKSHKDLMEKGEKWMKVTAQSCTVPAALIVTIMFAAAFTVPGGLIQDTGRPLLLHDKFFRLFIIWDAISLFSSAISMIMFLGILSSHYREADFLTSLPTKLMIGLFTLFLSIVAMMICFSAVLFILFDGESWVIFPTILSSSFPVTLYLIIQFRLLFEIFLSTYGPSIFEKHSRWL
ncbi:hypothetical protein UlMin_025497 [Ulmus minor]